MSTPTTDPRSTLTPGEIFAEDYRVESVLAEGGMGTVYDVVQRNTGKIRALKVLHQQFADDPSSRQRFVEESRIGTRIDSEHIVPVIDAGVAMPGFVPWYVMERLYGETLDARVARGGPLAPAEVLAIFEQVCHAIGAAHRIGIIHLDLKPENIFLAEARRADIRMDVRVLDFGIARVVPTLKTYADVSRAIGTPGWLSPEQLHNGGRVTLASDVWALGLVAFFALTGRSYWTYYEKFPVILGEIESSVLDPASARAAALKTKAMPPRGFDEVFERCVTRDPARRFSDATTMLDALRAALTPPPKRPAPAPEGRIDRAQMLELALEEAERRGQVDARVRIGEELLTLVAVTPELSARVAVAHVVRAWQLEQADDRSAALVDVRRAIELAPEQAPGHYALGVLCGRQLRFADALAALDRAVALNPAATGFVRERARMRFLLGAYPGAIEDYTLVLAQDPSRADHWIARALARLNLRELSAAESDLTRALEQEPGAVEAHRIRAVARGERGDIAGALADLEECVARVPGDSAVWYERARLRRVLGDGVAALDDLRQAAALGHTLAAQELRVFGVA